MKREDTREEAGKEIKRLEVLRAITRDKNRREELTVAIDKLNTIYWGN